MDRLSAIIASAVVAVGLGAGASIWLMMPGDNQCSAGQVAGDALIGGPFELTNQFGERVTDQEVITEPSLVYFGYIFCPDVCPFDVARNAEAIDILAERGISATPVFITIDPERDTVEEMNHYAAAMHERMIALTGTEEEIASAASAYRAVYQRRETDDPDFYLVDHSTFTYFMDPDGFQGFFRRTMTAEEIADEVECITGA
ncbi:MAG: SCO family protein [Pseudomonadota bacterium]